MPMLLSGSTSWPPSAIKLNAAASRPSLPCTRRGTERPSLARWDAVPQDRRAERGRVDRCMGRE
eukprot:4137997-Alexandrium_andersonii.AAC.1